MTAAAPGRSLPGDPDWVAAYEELRRAVTAADGRARRLPGVTVVLRAGVVGWMQTCRSLVRAVPPVGLVGEPARALPDTARAEVAMLLAHMALAAAGEVGT
jgi:hypothetical protein